MSKIYILQKDISAPNFGNVPKGTEFTKSETASVHSAYKCNYNYCCTPELVENNPEWFKLRETKTYPAGILSFSHPEVEQNNDYVAEYDGDYFEWVEKMLKQGFVITKCQGKEAILSIGDYVRYNLSEPSSKYWSIKSFVNVENRLVAYGGNDGQCDYVENLILSGQKISETIKKTEKIFVFHLSTGPGKTERIEKTESELTEQDKDLLLAELCRAWEENTVDNRRKFLASLAE